MKITNDKLLLFAVVLIILIELAFIFYYNKPIVKIETTPAQYLKGVVIP